MRRYRLVPMVLILLFLTVPFQNCSDGFRSTGYSSNSQNSQEGADNGGSGGSPSTPGGGTTSVPPAPVPAAIQNVWMKLPTTNNPTIYPGQAYLFGSTVLVFGTTNSSGQAFAGALLDLTTNAFKAISLTGVIPGRIGEARAWTGSKLILFSGANTITSGNTYSYSYRNDGAIYDVLTNSWTAMNMTGAPSPRIGAAEGWLGSKMVVFGGAQFVGSFPTSDPNSTQLYSDGALFDPTTNSWSAMNTSGFPIPLRYAPMSAAGGNKLFVFGGYNADFSYRNDAAIYDITSNSWTAVSIVNAPSARLTNKILWTGSKFIVWGGSTANNQYLNDGAIYDPTTNSWKKMSTVGAPVGRRAFAAVMNSTNDKMIVYGGEILGGYTNSGGIYDLTTDTWQAMDMTNGPGGREATAHVWTGDGLFVFGGQNSPQDTYLFK